MEGKTIEINYNDDFLVCSSHQTRIVVFQLIWRWNDLHSNLLDPFFTIHNMFGFRKRANLDDLQMHCIRGVARCTLVRLPRQCDI